MPLHMVYSSCIDNNAPGIVSSPGNILFGTIGPAVRADFRRLYPANAKTPTCCPSDDNRTKVPNPVTSGRSLWWHVGPYFWPADLTRTANPIRSVYYTQQGDNGLKMSQSATCTPPHARAPSAYTETGFCGLHYGLHYGCVETHLTFTDPDTDTDMDPDTYERRHNFILLTNGIHVIARGDKKKGMNVPQLIVYCKKSSAFILGLTD